MKERWTDLALVLSVCLIWSGSYFVIKAILPYIDPITFAFLRSSLSGLFVFAIAKFSMGGLRRSDAPWIIALGLFNVALFQIFLNVSLITAAPGVDSTLVYTQPIFVTALAPLIGEAMTRNKMVGIGAAFAGVVVIFLPSILSSSLVVGDLYALLASISWAIAVILFKRWRTAVNTNTITAVQSLVGGLFILPAVAFTHVFVIVNVQFILLLSYSVILASGMAYVLFWKALSRMPAAQFSSYFFLVPVFTVLIASALQLSVPPANEIAGTALVALGIVEVNR